MVEVKHSNERHPQMVTYDGRRWMEHEALLFRENATYHHKFLLIASENLAEATLRGQVSTGSSHEKSMGFLAKMTISGKV